MKNSELLQQQSNVVNMDNKNYGEQKNEELVKRWKIENSPLTVIWEENKGYYVVMGKYRLTDIFEQEHEVTQYTGIIRDHDADEWHSIMEWGFLTSVISAIVEETLNIRKGE